MRKLDFLHVQKQRHGQLCSYCTTDQCLCFRFMDSAVPPLLQSEITIFCDCTGRVVLGLIGTPKDQFSCVVSHMMDLFTSTVDQFPFEVFFND